MATPDIAPFNKYIGNGATTQFSVGFPYISKDFVHVYIKRINSVQEELESTDWEWTNDTTIRFPATGSSENILGNNEVLVIQRETPTENEFTFANQKRLFPEDVMKADDLDMQILQEQARELDRSVKVQPTSSVDPDTLIQQVERVYNSIDNIDDVADDLTNVNAVSADLSNIDIVAGSIANVNSVATDIANVNSVAGDLTNIDAVNANKTNIDKVAAIDDDVTAVAGNATNINAVNANKTNIDKVAGDINRVNLVADDIASVHTVAVDISNVIDVADNKTNIDTVATNVSDVSAVAGDIAKVTAVADDLTNIDAVNSNKTNINTVAGGISNVNTVGTNISSVNTTASNISAISNVSTDLSLGNNSIIKTVATNMDDINVVAGINSDVTTVADNMTNVRNVGGDITNIDTVSSNIGAVNRVSDSITEVSRVSNNINDVILVSENKSNINAVASDMTSVVVVASNTPNIDAVATNITDINTVASNSANINTAVNNLPAINAAPTYANNSKIWAEGLDGEVSPLGGTHSSKGWAEIAEQAASGVQNPANRDLSNLTNTGNMVIDSQNGTISNCVLEIPQNIKVELSNSVLTLKAGSIITRSGSTYSTLTTSVDKTANYSTMNNGRYVVFLDNTGTFLNSMAIGTIVSGDTDSMAGNPYHIWFDTTNKVINRYASDGSVPAATFTYPLCIVDVNNGTASFAKDSNGNDMIFNGCGFIGHHAFVYPNVRGLSPYRYNADGSLASIRTKSNSLIIKELPQNATDYTLCGLQYINGHRKYHTVDNVSDVDTTEQYSFWYIKNENITGYVNSGAFVVSSECLVITYSTTGTTVTDFTIRQPVRTATVEMLKDKQNDLTTVSGYDATATQVLKNINGVLTWVTEE